MKVKTLLELLRLIEEIEIRENNCFVCTTKTTCMPDFYLNREINNIFSNGKGKLVIDLEEEQE